MFFLVIAEKETINKHRQTHNPTFPEAQLQGYQFHPKHKISIFRYFYGHAKPTRSQREFLEHSLYQNKSLSFNMTE
jgi:hypothetical protein